MGTLLSILVLGGWIIDRRNSYSYDVAKDYIYKYTDKKKELISVPLNEDLLNIDPVEKGSTVLLKLEIEATYLGGVFQPQILLSSKEISLKQYFEYGASGIRYIDISQLVSEDGASIRLEGKYVTLKDQIVELIKFENDYDDTKTVLILSPHPDDAEIAAYGLYSSNNQSTVVTITIGDAGPKKYDEIYVDDVRHYRKKGQLRFWNSLMVPMLGGVSSSNVFNLGYFDGTLKKMYMNQDKVIRSVKSDLVNINDLRSLNISQLVPKLGAVSTWNSLVNDIKHLLIKLEPDVIITPSPLIDTNSDHKLTTIALLQAIRENDLKSGKLFLYTNHHPMSSLIPYGESGSLIAMPPNFGGDLRISSVYSYGLNKIKQKDKLLALESMNDLRLDTEWQTSAGITEVVINRYKDDLIGSDDYFRKAVRANEIFFVVDVYETYEKDYYNNLLKINKH